MRVNFLFLLLFVSAGWQKINAQCSSSSLLVNGSFEDQTCCPSDQDDLDCAVAWDDNVSADYYSLCGYMGIPDALTPPPGFPDGESCAGYAPIGAFGEHLQNCSPDALQEGESYQFSGYLGVNLDNVFGAPSSNPIMITLWGAPGPCTNNQSNAICPTSNGFDSLTTLSFDWDSTGWYSAVSDCFVAPTDMSSFLIGSCNNSNGPDFDYLFVDLLEIYHCDSSILEVDVNVSAGCTSSLGGSIELVINSGTPPYMFDWDIDGTGDFDDDQNQNGLSIGTYTVVIIDSNGASRCLEISMTSSDVAPTNFFGLPTEFCQFDPEFVLPTESDDVPPVEGIWSQSTIQTDTPGTFIYNFEPIGCATPFTHTVTVRRQSLDTGFFEYVGCEGDGFTIIVDGTIFSESNPSGVEPIETSTVCDSFYQVSLTFNELPLDTFSSSQCIESDYFITVNGTVYDVDNPTGMEVFSLPDACDSTVVIDLEFIENTPGFFINESCEGSGYSIMINGTLYDEFNPTGIETLEGDNGCDSVVSINLMFFEDIVQDIDLQFCDNSNFSITVNGTLYDINNPSGVEVMQSAAGCDSIVSVDLEFADIISDTFQYVGCLGDGYSIEVNATTYNETNPTGMETLISAAGCDSVVSIDLVFNDEITSELNYSGCIGDGYSVDVNATTYNEANPTGMETLTSATGCDSVISINLVFNDEVTDEINYSGCIGDGYSIDVNTTTYNEANPTGMETLTSAAGCDSVISINLVFSDEITSEVNYSGCIGDGYSVDINATTYNEANPTGMETLTSAAGCDSVISINLVFNNEITNEVNYSGCVGDGYSIDVNTTTYNEANPTGMETLTSAAGCDSVISINLVFNDEVTDEINYSGCIGDGYSIDVNTTTYNEANPTGMETLTSAAGCDSVISINLVFNDEITNEINYSGCIGDGYSIDVNTTTYNEANPTGMETLTSAAGCDSVISINLVFNNEITNEINYAGCIGDGYSIDVNTTTYNEANPTGMETLTSAAGCDSVISINLVFNDEITNEINYAGCIGDGYSIDVNTTTYNEANPTGMETLTSAAGCDSVISINLVFNNEITDEINYSGCIGDGYSIDVNTTTYNEANPTGTETFVSATGCDSIVSINLEFVESLSNQIVYEGCAGDAYSITVGTELFDESNPSGTVQLVSSTGCDSIVEVDLIFENDVEIILASQVLSVDNNIIELSTLLENDVDSIINVNWLTMDVSCASCVVTSYIGQSDATVSAEVVDASGCTLLITLPIEYLMEATDYFIPNAFSPNDDGINDRFVIFTPVNQPVEIISFNIYNRWGGLVYSKQSFSSLAQQEFWDGTNDGRLLNPGIFVYTVVMDTGTEIITTQGEVILTR